MRISRKVLRLLSLLLIPAAGLFAGVTAEAPSPLPKTMAVAAFKNGLAFVLRQGEIPLSRGTARISPIPTATLGTLWLAPANPEDRIDEVVAYRYNASGVQAISSLGEVLRANAGRTVTITYQMKEYTGEVVGLKQTEPDSTTLVVADASVKPREDYLLLKMNSRLMAFPLGGISTASLPEDAVLRESVERPSQALRLNIKNGSTKEKLTLGYLEHGFGWTPSYLISLTDDTNAQITMQAVVTNDAEDVENAELFFVVGVPNFAYADTLSPMSLQQSLVDYMKDAERDFERKKSFGALSNAISGQALMMDEKEAIGGPISITGGVDEMASAPEEDLFLYSRADVTLAKGERASYNVFSGNVSYEHLYNWEVEDQPRVDGYGNVTPNQIVQDGSRADSVWHAIRLKNATKLPWTSAPALVMAGQKPVSQDTLPYTPKGASSTLKITVATDIRASHEEREVARQQEVTHRRGYNYDLVTVEGKLKMKNYKSKAVHLAIGKTLRGKTEFQSDEGKTVQLGEGIESDNPRSHLTWDLKLGAGEEKVVTYRYKIWVRA